MYYLKRTLNGVTQVMKRIIGKFFVCCDSRLSKLTMLTFSLTVHDRILSQLAQCEFSVLKSELSTQMIEEEEINYKRVSDSISTSIELVRKQIELSKENLVAAKKIRKNKMEYDVLAKIINQQPDRSETVKEHEVLKTELDELHEKYQKLNKMLDNRRKDFANFMNSIRELELLKDPEIEDVRDLSCEAFDDLVEVSEDKMIIDE